MEVFNSEQYGSTPYQSGAVVYDFGTKSFYALNGSSFEKIKQEIMDDVPILNTLELEKLFEMMDDWERQKYPERFL